MSMGEIIIILIVAILVLGPEKLPSVIIQCVKVFKALKAQIDDAKSSIEKEIRIDELKKEGQKYQDELSKYNQNIRKKLSFEEFDELKKDILDDVGMDSKSTGEIKENLQTNSKYSDQLENAAETTSQKVENNV